ncbi:MAG: hypothetical protein NTU83_06765, partial [Candidatus Hydrogenedentes bacterium]|nr:hypothetical protein [Candidatus Hydrogenedentota bacterium]
MICSTFVLIVLTAQAQGGVPKAEDGLHFDTPVTVWDEAMPLGDGLLGALVWGDGNPIKISLDRTDLWDLRPVPEFHSADYSYARMREWEKAGKVEELLNLYDRPYERPAPTKIPAGRIELTIGGAPAFRSADLSLADATARVLFKSGTEVRVWVHATECAGMIEVHGDEPVAAKLVAPAFGGGEAGPAKPAIVAGDLTQLGYPDPASTSGETWSAYKQEGWGGFQFAVYLAWRATPGTWRAAWSVVSNREHDEPLKEAKANVERVLDAEPNAVRASHADWWTGYWAKTWLAVPNAAIERQWYLDTYKFGAASRRGSPPITLQGPWTADDGKLPPWKGDYHHDLNTQLSYWPCYAGNRLDEGLSYLDWLWDTRGNCREWTRRFFDMPGMNVPMTADLNNNQIGGWRQYTHSSTTGAWLAHHFYLHWKFSADREFLAKRAYPYLCDCATFIEAVTSERGPDGKRTLPLSSSPEINDNRPTAWFASITNYDLALIRWLFTASAELADALEKTDEAAHWRAVCSEMPGFSLGEEWHMVVAKDYPLRGSHRHFSHLFMIYPLHLVDAESAADRPLIEKSLDHWQSLPEALRGYSY